MDYTKLKAELTNDPLGRGYLGMSDEAVAVDLNVVYRERNVESVSGQEVFEAVDQADFVGLSAAYRSLLYAIIGIGTILVNGANTKAALLAMFGAGTQTRSNLAGLQKEDISRAVELGLETVYEGTIQQARATKSKQVEVR